MGVNSRYAAMLREARKTPDYWMEGWALEITGAVVEVMQREGISQQDLADRMDAKPSFVSRILGGPHNMTLATAAKLLTAVGLGGVFKPIPILDLEQDARQPGGTTVHSLTTRRRHLRSIAQPVVEFEQTYAPETSAKEAYSGTIRRFGNGART